MVVDENEFSRHITLALLQEINIACDAATNSVLTKSLVLDRLDYSHAINMVKPSKLVTMYRLILIDVSRQKDIEKSIRLTE